MKFKVIAKFFKRIIFFADNIDQTKINSEFYKPETCNGIFKDKN